LVIAAASSSGIKYWRCRFSTVAMRRLASLDKLVRISTGTTLSETLHPVEILAA